VSRRDFWPHACRKMVILYVYLNIGSKTSPIYRADMHIKNLRWCVKEKLLHTILHVSAYLYTS
jgi:hypothetical protein